MRLRNKDIAERLGISVTAVSLAINGRPGVSQETRRKVLEFLSESAQESVRDLNPSAVPVTMNEVRHGTVVLSIHKKHGEVMNDKPFFSNLVESAQIEAQKLGYTVTLAHYVASQGLDEYMNYIRSIGPVGIIVEATEINSDDLAGYQRLGIPLVLIDCSFDLSCVDAVELDNQVSIFREFDYAYRMGHRNIGFLQASTYINNFGHHLDGFMKGIHEYGLEESNHPFVRLGCQVDTAYSDMRSFLSNPPEGFEMPTCFLSDLDYIAIGAMQALKEAGYRIPEDVSVVGYDDVPLSEASDPALTTTRVNRGDAGEVAMRILDERIRVNPDYFLTVQVSSELIVRDSVRKL